MPSHPDHEQLAAFQAGDGDRRQRADVQAHLAGCPSCAEVAASVEQARRRLALLEEPALPPGLHDRLAAAVGNEAARTAPAGPAPWYRRPVAWGVAAALLLAALVIPFLDRSGGDLTTTGGGSADSAQEAASSGAGGLPVLRLPGEVTAAKVRAELAADSRAKAALDSASAAAAQPATPRAGQDTGSATQSPAGGDRYGPETLAPQAGPPSTPAPHAGAANLEPCLPAATAAANPAITPLRPAFFIQGTYQGREATILVTTSAGQPGRVDLWVFPRDNCSTPPLTSEKVR